MEDLLIGAALALSIRGYSAAKKKLKQMEEDSGETLSQRTSKIAKNRTSKLLSRFEEEDKGD